MDEKTFNVFMAALNYRYTQTNMPNNGLTEKFLKLTPNISDERNENSTNLKLD